MTSRHGVTLTDLLSCGIVELASRLVVGRQIGRKPFFFKVADCGAGRGCWRLARDAQKLTGPHRHTWLNADEQGVDVRRYVAIFEVEVR